jgi:hypothetical protein
MTLNTSSLSAVAEVLIAVEAVTGFLIEAMFVGVVVQRLIGR